MTASTPGVEARVVRRDRRLESRSSRVGDNDDDVLVEFARALALFRASRLGVSVTLSIPGAVAREDFLDLRFESLSSDLVSRRGDREVL